MAVPNIKRTSRREKLIHVGKRLFKKLFVFFLAKIIRIDAVPISGTFRSGAFRVWSVSAKVTNIIRWVCID